MATKAAAFGSFGVLYGNVEFDREATLRDQVGATREFIASNVIWYVRNALFVSMTTLNIRYKQCSNKG